MNGVIWAGAAKRRRVAWRAVRASFAGALLLLALPCAVALAAPPNDDRGGAAVLPLDWSGKSQSVTAVGVADWTQATATGDPAPSCSGPDSDHSLWWSFTVSEPGWVQIAVRSPNVASFQPVVSVYDAASAEVACAVASSNAKVNAPAETSAYVFPNSDGSPQVYLIRVAQAVLQPASNRPDYELDVTARDLTPPHIAIALPKAAASPHGPVQTYRADGSTDAGSGIDWSTAVWTFHDGFNTIAPMHGQTARHQWRTPGLHRVEFTVQDFAGNRQTYTFFVFVHDFAPPTISAFGALSVPFPGDHFLRVVVQHDEPIRLRLVVTQGQRLLFRENMRLLKGHRAVRRLHLTAGVARTPFLTLSGTAKDSAGNTTVLPVCQLDPMSGAGSCFKQ